MNISEIARALGRRGGLARARRLSVSDRKRIAALGGRARRQSFQTARRISDNFRYVAAIGELRQPAPVKRLSTFTGPLPGLYPDRPDRF